MKTTIMTSPPGLPVCQGQSTTGTLNPDQARLGQELNRIAATGPERDAAALFYRLHGIERALRLVRRFRDPEMGQMQMWGRC